MRYLLPMLVLISACTTIEAGNAGVETSWGRVTGKVYSEGTYSTGPNTDIHLMSVRLQNLEEQDVPCRSKDNVSVMVDVTISYALERTAAAKVYRALGDDYAALVLLPALRSSIRDAMAGAEALEIAQGRGTLEQAVERTLRASVTSTLTNQHLPPVALRIDSVQLRNVDLPASLTQSIESIQRQRNAGLERQQALQTAQYEARRLQAEQEGRNAVATLAAQNQADIRLIAGNSEAAYNRTVSASITPTLVELRRIDAQRAIASNPNAQLVVLGGGGGGNSAPPIILQTPPR